MSFYKPFSVKISKISVILYPEVGLEQLFERSQNECLEEHLQNLYDKHDLQIGQYHIVILWRDQKDVMTDVWIYEGISYTNSIPTVDVKNFKNWVQVNEGGVTAGDGLILLGREEELRRKSMSLEKYISGPRPSSVYDIIKPEEFYI